MKNDKNKKWDVYSVYAKSKIKNITIKIFLLCYNSKKLDKNNNSKFSESSENSNKNNNKYRNRNNIVLYSKTRDLNDSSNILLDNSKSNKYFPSDKNKGTFQLKKERTLSEKNFENSKEQIKCELKKIKQFKKIVTRNSKVFAQKFGKEIISSKNSRTNVNNIKKNNSLVIKLFKKKKNDIRNSKFFKSDIININNNNENKSENIIINNKNENDKDNDNINKKSQNNQSITIKNYSLKNINVNIFNSFKIINNNEKVKRRNSCILLYKNKPIMNKTFIHKSNFSPIGNIIPKKNEKINQNRTTIKTIDSAFKISKNISVFFKKNIRKEKANKYKFNDELKIGFYSLMIKSLIGKNFKSLNQDIEHKEKIEEEKRRFLFELFYCLELSKIYIFNFKQNKQSSNQYPILLLNQSSNIHNSTDIPIFKHFYEIFSDFSQIKISTQEKYEAYPNIEHVNQYYIFKDKQIGKGGSSVVYLGEDEKQKKYAIKVTSKNLKANPSKKIYDYVKEEVSILKRIHSQYIVTTYEVIESRNKIYIIMEYMSAGSVLNILEFMDEKKIKQYTRDLVCAVEHCHEIANVIHKDINVNNILINQDGISKLCDFGISETFENNNDLLLSKGPSTYTPPEKICKEKYNGKPADIYLIGLTLYHMVFKKPLFTDFGNLTKDDYLNIKIPKTDHKNREINNNLYNLLESLLKFNPEERPTISKLKKDPWLTDNMINPLPDVIKEALFYSLELTKRQIKEISENEEKKNESSNNDDEENKENQENEDESSDDSESSNES